MSVQSEHRDREWAQRIADLEQREKSELNGAFLEGLGKWLLITLIAAWATTWSTSAVLPGYAWAIFAVIALVGGWHSREMKKRARAHELQLLNDLRRIEQLASAPCTHKPGAMEP